jgi:hypothetical protein
MLTTSPFRSGMFLNASVLALLCTALDAYLLFRHWRALNAYIVGLLIVPIALQLVGQWWRGFRYYARMRQWRSDMSGNDQTVEDSAESTLDIARSISDLLFWSFMTNLFLLLYVGVILMHLDGLR